jgi:hypothetical protein
MESEKSANFQGSRWKHVVSGGNNYLFIKENQIFLSGSGDHVVPQTRRPQTEQ